MADLSRGACAGMADESFAESDPFFPNGEDSSTRGKRKPRDYTAAAAVCARCPIVAECLKDALNEDVQWGYRAGMTAEQRQALKSKPGRPVNKFAPTGDHLAMRGALYEQGLSDPAIAQQLNVAAKTVTTWRKRNNLPPNIQPQRPHSPEQQLLKQQAYDAGLSDRLIAARAGVKVNSVKKWRARFGLPVNPDERNPARRMVPA